LRHFYKSYTPVVSDAHHTCVGLGLELLDRLCGYESRWPGLKDKLHLVSCEEAIDDPEGYTRPNNPEAVNTEKEHVLVCLNISVAGRKGVLLLDPGYHVARVITVMRDQSYPHTGISTYYQIISW
jgi:hypothetical protein